MNYKLAPEIKRQIRVLVKELNLYTLNQIRFIVSVLLMPKHAPMPGLGHVPTI